jgi:hypothetical protein
MSSLARTGNSRVSDIAQALEDEPDELLPVDMRAFVEGGSRKRNPGHLPRPNQRYVTIGNGHAIEMTIRSRGPSEHGWVESPISVMGGLV